MGGSAKRTPPRESGGPLKTQSSNELFPLCVGERGICGGAMPPAGLAWIMDGWMDGPRSKN